MINDESDSDSPLMTSILPNLDENDANSLRRWIRMKTLGDKPTPDTNRELMFGMTAVVCDQLSKQFVKNAQLQDALKIITNEVIKDKASIFLPPDQPKPKAIPVPRPMIFLPPDDPNNIKLCQCCGQVLP